MVDTSIRDGGPAALRTYWTKGPGLARWATNPHPYTALCAALASEGVPAHMIRGLAANLFKIVFGIYPGQREGIGHGR